MIAESSYIFSIKEHTQYRGLRLNNSAMRLRKSWLYLDDGCGYEPLQQIAIMLFKKW